MRESLVEGQSLELCIFFLLSVNAVCLCITPTHLSHLTFSLSVHGLHHYGYRPRSVCVRACVCECVCVCVCVCVFSMCTRWVTTVVLCDNIDNISTLHVIHL